MLKIKIENEYNLYNNLEFEFNEGLTCLIGKNGAGKSTLLKIIRDMFKEDCFYYDNEDREKNAMQEYAYHGNMKLVARNFCSSEGQNIRNNFEDYIPKIGRYVTTQVNNKKDKAIILLDGLDSGISLDYAIILKDELFSLILEDCQKRNLKCYIIISANNYEFCNKEDCIYVTTAEHYKFNNYDEFKQIYIRKKDNNE